MSGLMDVAVSGLLSFQHGLQTTAHNIVNANTEGYTRQKIDLSTGNGRSSEGGFIGTGVQVSNVTRVYDQFLTTQVRTSTSAFNDLDSFHTLTASVDDVLGQSSTSLSPALTSFFNAVQKTATDPNSIPARQSLLAEANSVTNRFSTLDKQLESLDKQVGRSLGTIVTEINDLASAVADVNAQVVAATRQSGGKAPNDLLDQRDLLLTRLAEKIDVTAVAQPEGAMDIFIGNGQPLVVGSSLSKLGIRTSVSDPNRQDIVIQTQTLSPAVVTNQMVGGELGGSLRFRDEVLDSARRQLGLLAVGVSQEFNRVHRTGYDLAGGTGSDFFKPFTIPVSSGSAGTLTAAFNASVQDLKPSDYRLTVDAAGANYTLTRLSDNQVIGTNNTGTFSADGLDISVNGAAGGDSFLIRPTFSMAGQIAVATTDPRKIAASASDTVAGNTIGDNEVALKLAGLRDASPLMGGTAKFQDYFGEVVTEVATKTQSAATNRTAHESVMRQAIQSRDSVSGVNLDEEAANLQKYQQAYQAAAQVVATTKAVFDSLIGAMAR
jgi:flagellar hook-associated protein 1 FlgK